MRIDLDANATTPVLPEVLEAMQPFWRESYGNPSSAHQSGRRTRGAVEQARIAVASLLHCSPKEIVFTSGGTESDNLALSGVLQPWLDRRASEDRARHEPAHLITTQIEHDAVLSTAQSLERRGIEVTYLKPDSRGVVSPEDVEAALRPHTKLVSVMLANNETGAVQPVGKIARIAKAHGALVHTDAVQGAGKLPLDLSGEFKNVDLLSISGHKMYAPQGTGALFVRQGIELAPILLGGPHERQRRAGTENVPGIVGLGRAAELALAWLEGQNHHLVASPSKLAAEIPGSQSPAELAARRSHFEKRLLALIPEATINAAGAPRVSNTINLRIDDVDGEALIIALDLQGIAASFGSACSSGAAEPSHVLVAMGLTPKQAHSSFRLSLSRLTTDDEIARALEIIPAAVAHFRSVA